MNWTIISNIASISTLILFIMYFVGRIWYIIQNKNDIDESLQRGFSEDFKIVEEYDVGSNTCEEIYLTASVTLLNVKIYECEYSEKKCKFLRGKLYMDCGSLRNGFTFKFNSYLVEGIPMYMIEYIANDYTKGILTFSENGKNGIIDELIHKKHTFRSVMYYLFK